MKVKVKKYKSKNTYNLTLDFKANFPYRIFIIAILFLLWILEFITTDQITRVFKGFFGVRN